MNVFDKIAKLANANPNPAPVVTINASELRGQKITVSEFLRYANVPPGTKVIIKPDTEKKQ